MVVGGWWLVVGLRLQATTISLNELVAGNVTEWELINPKKRVGRKAKKYINSGVLRLKK